MPLGLLPRCAAGLKASGKFNRSSTVKIQSLMEHILSFSREYKGERRYGEVLLRYLDEMAGRGKEETEVKPYPY